MCEEGFDVDCAPEVCARELGQTIVASKHISGRVRFILMVLNEGVCILHPDGRAPSPNVPPLTGLFVVAGTISHPDRVGVGYGVSSLRDFEEQTSAERPANNALCLLISTSFCFPVFLLPCLLASFPACKRAREISCGKGGQKVDGVNAALDTLTYFESISYIEHSMAHSPSSIFPQFLFFMRLDPASCFRVGLGRPPRPESYLCEDRI